jgi:hypothetical protein
MDRIKLVNSYQHLFLSPASATEEQLRSAQPCLIQRCRVDFQSKRAQANLHIYEVEHGWDEVIDEGYDRDYIPLGRPVYWRIVKRGDEHFYLSTFLMTRDEVKKLWGRKGVVYCDPVTGLAAARVETELTGKASTDDLGDIFNDDLNPSLIELSDNVQHKLKNRRGRKVIRLSSQSDLTEGD